VICPQCGRKAKIRLFTCSRPLGGISLFSKKVLSLKGSRVVIYGEWCDRRKAEQLRAAREEDLKALKNPFLPYYDEYFRKYR
jgi:hypothetical protein